MGVELFSKKEWKMTYNTFGERSFFPWCVCLGLICYCITSVTVGRKGPEQLHSVWWTQLTKAEVERMKKPPPVIQTRTSSGTFHSSARKFIGSNLQTAEIVVLLNPLVQIAFPRSCWWWTKSCSAPWSLEDGGSWATPPEYSTQSQTQVWLGWS